MMYNDNKYFYYTRRRIIKYLLSLYKKTYNKIFLLYKKTYNKNISCHYTRRCIMKIFVSIIQGDV